MSDKTKLKPCPWCGSTNLAENDAGDEYSPDPKGRAWIECRGCDATGPSVPFTHHDWRAGYAAAWAAWGATEAARPIQEGMPDG